MREYINHKSDSRKCYTNDKKSIDFNWSLYEHKGTDNSMDIISAKYPIYQAKYPSKKLNNWRIAYVSPNINSNLEIEFKDLAEKWEMETGLFSIDRARINDTFLDIISLGKDIVPFILNDMLKPTGTARWHIALKTLTKANPLTIEDLSKSNVIKEKWIQWGKENNII